MTHTQVTALWPLLGSRAAAFTKDGIDAVVAQIVRAVSGLPDGPISARSQLYNIPSTRSAHFVGRDADMVEVESLLDSSGSVRIAASVEGLAGIGKTELALQLAHAFAKRGTFPGGIYWLEAERSDLTPIWGGRIADELGLDILPLADRATLSVRSISRCNAPVLVVLDNVEEWSSLNRPNPLPAGPHVKFLITTRRSNLGGMQFTHKTLCVLSVEAARQLIEHASRRNLSVEIGFDALIDYLDGHALPLCQ